jgi:hypothetical protein
MLLNVPDADRDEQAGSPATSNRSPRKYLGARRPGTASGQEVADVLAAARARLAATGRRLDAKTILAARDAGRN